MTIEVTEELKSLGIEGPQIRAIIGNIRDDKKIAKIEEGLKDAESIKKLKELEIALGCEIKHFIRILANSTGDVKKQIAILHKRKEEIKDLLQTLEMKVSSFCNLIGEPRDNGAR